MFGVLSLRTGEATIARTRDTASGLAANVFPRHVSKACQTARAVPAGCIWINICRNVRPMMSFGGARSSGFGRGAGVDAIGDGTRTIGLFIDVSAAPMADPFVMP